MRTPTALIALVVLALSASPALAQQPAGTIAFTIGAGPGGISTTTFGGTPTALVTGQTGNPSWSPDGSTLAFAAQLPRSGDQQVRTIAAGGGAATTVASNGEDPTWSPDGSRIAFVSTGPRNGVRVVSSTGGAARTVVTPARPRSTSISKIAWLRGGRIAYTQVHALATQHSVTTLYTVAPAGGAPRKLLLQLPAGMVLTGDSLSASPDGQTLAVTLVAPAQPNGPRILALVPVAGGAPTATVANTWNGSFSPDGTMLCVAQGDYPVFSTLAIVSVTGAPVLTPSISASECAWRPVAAGSQG